LIDNEFNLKITLRILNPENQSSTGDFMKKVLTATCALRDRIVSIEQVYTPSTFYMNLAVYY